MVLHGLFCRLLTIPSLEKQVLCNLPKEVEERKQTWGLLIPLNLLQPQDHVSHQFHTYEHTGMSRENLRHEFRCCLEAPLVLSSVVSHIWGLRGRYDEIWLAMSLLIITPKLEHQCRSITFWFGLKSPSSQQSTASADDSRVQWDTLDQSGAFHVWCQNG